VIVDNLARISPYRGASLSNKKPRRFLAGHRESGASIRPIVLRPASSGRLSPGVLTLLSLATEVLQSTFRIEGELRI